MTRAERVAARVLFWGAVLGIAVMVAGLGGAALATGAALERAPRERHAGGLVRPPAAAPVTSLPHVLRSAAHRPTDPAAIATLGVLTLLVTPIAAVAATIPAFLIDGDRRYAAIATLLLLVLSASLWLGHG
jgi:hypothetical protein